MKKTINIFILVVSICFASTCMAGETIRLTNGEWPPYFSKNLRYYGIGSRIVSAAFALGGVEVGYGFYPWSRALVLAQTGEWDGAVGWESNAEREVHFFVSDPVWDASWVFFHLKTLPFDWNTFDDLKDVRIGGTLKYMYTDEFLKAERSGRLHVERSISDGSNFKKLLAGRIDIFPQLIDVGYFQLRHLFDPKTAKLFTYHRTPFGKHTDRLLLSKKHDRNRQMMEIFNDGLKKLKESGKYNRYLEDDRSGENLK